MKDLRIDRLAPSANNVIRVTVPPATAFNLKNMNKITEIVLGRLGCPECHSGFDLRFDFERQFLFNAQNELIGH